MKAIYCTKYGPPEVLEVREVPKPAPKDNEVLIKIHASSVGPSDCAFRKGEPVIVRLMFGLRRPRIAPGTEFAGEIEAVGKAVTRFKPGDAVFGMGFGSHAEYKCMPETDVLALKPSNATPEETVGVLDGGATALTFLRDVAKIQPGQKILINGASGAVGIYAVQLAKYYGAEVTGVCSGKNVNLVKSMGADHVIDYTQEDFTQREGAYDVIFDAIGKSNFSGSKRALKPKGMYMTTVPDPRAMLQMLWTSLVGGKQARFTAAGLRQNQDNLNFIKDLVEQGKIRAVIDRCYPMADIAEAHRYVDTERKKGNVILMVNAS